MIRNYVVNLGLALLTSVFCMQFLAPIATRIGFVDEPNERKRHDAPIPLVGGISIFFGFCLALLALPPVFSLRSMRMLIAGSAFLVLMGVMDDFKELSPRFRLLGQIGVAFLMVVGANLMIQHVGHLFFSSDLYLGLWAVPVTVLVIVANLNAMNMIDGQDGLAGLVALGQALLLLYLAILTHLDISIHFLAILAVLLLVFLSFNMRMPWRSRASIFLGDSGSTFVAFVLSWFAVQLSQVHTTQFKPIIVLWVMAFPIFDLLNVVLHRFFQRKPLMVASRDHFHHILQVAGVNTALSTWLLGGLSFGLGSIGLLLNHYKVSEGIQGLLFLGILMAYFCMIGLVLRPQQLESAEEVIHAEV